MILWTWEVSAQRPAASGVCGEVGQAKRAASVWMLAYGVNVGRVERVRLSLGAGSLLTLHEPTGLVLQARMGQGGQVGHDLHRCADPTCHERNTTSDIGGHNVLTSQR